ncbi:TPA: dTDP-4-dehydrorhamnose 3,5-epimerase [Candidatus Uhrbacteria bacterium]|nr:MAG: dTDP-4-dehydrorhamnose 3,5-epimerase [Candidatus Uhrbacteria bacterium RIFCSPHIGHO2_02_FULL_54_11]HBL39899.1 dTDP-4-dehydrorhamnose 3,5-epimerase [Candidatus Uhrbacteria bacterium]
MSIMSVPTTQVTGHATEIPGLIVFDVTKVGDERGWFQEKYQKEKLVAAGMPADFNVVQNSLVYNRKGVTRGFHAEPWDKYVSVASGRVFVAYVDLRAGERFGRTVTLELDEEKAVFVPRGVGNSYQCLTDDCYYLYSVNQHWSEEAYKNSLAVNMADPEIGINWPIPLSEAILSDRDRAHPMLSEI